MDMLEKIRKSIIAPQQLVAYRNDRVFPVLLYMLFFALISATGTIIQVATFDGLPLAYRQEIRENYQSPPAACAIESERLVCDEEISHTVFAEGFFAFTIDAANTADEAYAVTKPFHFVVHDDTLRVDVTNFFGTVSHEMPLSELAGDPESLSFTFDPDDRDEEDAFFGHLFSVIDAEIDAQRLLWGTPFILLRILGSLAIFFGFVIMNAFLMTLFIPKVRFRQMFVMMAYASTLLYVVIVFHGMLDFSMILLFVLLFLAFRQTSRLVMEIQRLIRGGD